VVSAGATNGPASTTNANKAVGKAITAVVNFVLVKRHGVPIVNVIPALAVLIGELACVPKTFGPVAQLGRAIRRWFESTQVHQFKVDIYKKQYPLHSMNRELNPEQVLQVLMLKKLPKFTRFDEVTDFVTDFMMKHYHIRYVNHINQGIVSCGSFSFGHCGKMRKK
jgi:hypothetical protein